MKGKFFEQNTPLLFAHRGASSIAPENTRASFQKALETGCRGIELDVHLTKDGQLAVIHDSTLSRTCRIRDSQTGQYSAAPHLKVEDLTLKEIKEFDAGIWFSSSFEGEQVQSLEEVLDMFGDDVFVDIEMKSSSFFCKSLAFETAKVLECRNKGNYMVSSFNPASLFHFKHMSAIPTALIYAYNNEVPAYLRRGQGRFLCRPDILKPAWYDYKVPFSKEGIEMYLERNVSGIKKTGRPVFFWTVDDPDIAQFLVNAGAKGIITNKPQVLKELPCFSQL